jgi:predicted phosphodiesterase
LESFLAGFDLHVGYERRNRHKVALHDTKAIGVMMAFAKDFKPDHFILGGDALDCGPVSHHNHGKPGAVEGLRILSDAKELTELVVQPAQKLSKHQYYIIGNHEAWLDQAIEVSPALEGILDAGSLLKLDGWSVIPQGEALKLGKLVFVHGDQIKGGENPAKWAVNAYNKNVFFGHHHTHQVFTKVSALDSTGHTGTAVPCLCKKNPKYGGGSPNRWMQGFVYGWLHKDGTFSAYTVLIINGKATIMGKVYCG